MKIAISSTSNNIEGDISDIFGRCPFFIIAEINNQKTENIELVKNQAINQTSGAGITAAQLIVENNVEAVITGNVGPRALDILNQFKISVYYSQGSIKKALENLINKKLKKIN